MVRRAPRFDTGDPNRREWEYTDAERRNIAPTPLRLFFPRFDYLPTDTRDVLREFVPPPEAFAVPTLDAPQATHILYEHTSGATGSVTGRSGRRRSGSGRLPGRPRPTSGRCSD